jgi:hypothetical protein
MPKIPSARKQADDAKALAKLLVRIETNLKAREVKNKGNLKIGTAAS